MPQIDCFSGCGVKGFHQCHRLIVFGEDAASKEEMLQPHWKRGAKTQTPQVDCIFGKVSKEASNTVG